ncbi:SCO family protein [Flavobacterium sp. HXWNR69]|uniref:SCO family protein n=1 Tax=Flavobacterium fragile TaxID=2949085 RepID=A0ABT0TGC2_9FLAO|nr:MULTISPECIES: SCO family protein [unclassified Flavobacterium]MCL9769947.1 SCO family protein [Flavobacterium sp. HXWNR69]MDD3005599.1 SCO family protein [Flavobacterium sp.]
MKKIIWLLFLLITFGCSQKPDRLPYLGNPIIKVNDTIYPTIMDFSFINQDSVVITNKTFESKIYIADFIFLSCPTICPKMNFELNKVYEVYKNNPKVNYLSHTIDPERDSTSRLKDFKSSLSLNENWHFVTGNKDSIFNIATKSYFTTAYPDENEPGGLVHGGGFLLVDKNKHIRGVYDGTNPEETKRLINDIKILLDE